jgi:hypothetical protein
MLADAFSALGCDVSSGKLSWQRLCTMLKGDGKSGSSGKFIFNFNSILSVIDSVFLTHSGRWLGQCSVPLTRKSKRVYDTLFDIQTVSTTG